MSQVATGSVIVLFVSSVVAACSGGSNSSDPGTACASFAQAELSQLQRCDGVSYPSDVESSVTAAFESLCKQELALPGTGETAQRISDCVGSLGSLPCRGSNTPAACEPVPGTLALGSACNDGAQCQSGVCAITTNNTDGGTTGGPKCGMCAASIPLGQPCGMSLTTCAPGGSCLGGVCTPVGTVDVGGACVGTTDCKTGLECNAQKCAALGAVGATCLSADQCQVGLVCTGKCATAIPVGGDCSMAPTSCDVGLVCDATMKKCATVQVASPGAACSLNPYVTCALGGCDITNVMAQTGSCPTLVPDGQPCDSSDKTKTCGYLSSCLVTQGMGTMGVCTSLFGTTTCM